MKICVINSFYKPYSRGGTETVVENLVEGLQKQGHKVIVVSSRAAFYLNKFPWPIRLLWHGFDMFNLAGYLRVKKILKKEKPDLVMVHNLKGLGFLIPRLIEKKKIKYIQTVHDVQLVVPSGLLIKGEEKSFLNTFWLARLWQTWSRWLFASPDLVVFPSKWLKEFYEQRGFFPNSKLVVMPNPTRNFQIPNNNFQINSKSKISKFADFLFIGQIEKHKGILFLIEVFKNLKLKINLHIVGDGSCLALAKKLAQNNPRIIFHGRLSNNEVHEMIGDSTCLVVPSLCYENSPTVIYESLSHGVPVIASNLGGIGELIKDGHNGWLFEAGNKNSLIGVIEKFSELSTEDQENWRKECLESVKGMGVDNYIGQLLNLIV